MNTAMKEENKFTPAPRVCSHTGEGMWEGWCAGDGAHYFKYEKDALNYAISVGYDSIDEAYDDEHMYWTQWED